MKCWKCKKIMQRKGDLVTDIPFGNTYYDQHDGSEYGCSCGHVEYVPWWVEREMEEVNYGTK